MNLTSKHLISFFLLIISLIFSFLLNISSGSVAIPLSEVAEVLTGGKIEKTSWEYIILNYRLPKAIVAVLVGCALSVSGMLMQTLFRNPMAEPYVLGLSSGSGLGVALVVLGAGLFPVPIRHYFTSPYSLIIASVLGSIMVMFLILIVLRRMNDTMILLIIGLMLSSFSGAIVSILSYFSTAEELQKFTFWAMGSLGNQSWKNILIMTIGISVGLILSSTVLKAMNALLLGENYARSLGFSVTKPRFIIVIATALLSGIATAFVGPVAFVGLAVPHMARIILKTNNHFILFFFNMLCGAVILLLSDALCHLPNSSYVLPTNAITSILGAPVVILLLLRMQKYKR